jgi:hypothetical protein
MNDWMDLINEEWNMQYGGGVNYTANATTLDPVACSRMTETWDRNVTANGTSL